ncbi:hypothetical protein [Helicobacter winghamensis]|uniref:hypothetical protein n=1 Tax=Helicobacter winghamensis TaxID=157268 RepID=UPI0015D61442|nr:hypothetical protein [Helicobacter winghamensis]
MQGLSDTRISQITSIPLITISQWKKREPNDYRYKLYKLLKTSDESFLINKFQNTQAKN